MDANLLQHIISEIKQGVDDFNDSQADMKCGYPEFITIERDGIKLTLPVFGG